ncbi:MAG: hypothetical protein AB1607_06565 [Chloroflexota bacterium]
MTDTQTRIENAKKTITGNESLLDMLDAEAATLLLNWGMHIAERIARSTDGMDDASAESNLEPRLKALRQFMRAVGNWAAGKYGDADGRAQLKDRLSEHLNTMNLPQLKLPASREIENLLSLSGKAQEQLVIKIKDLLSTAE